MTKQSHNSLIIREATIDDIFKYKRGKKDVNPKEYYLCQCDCGNYWTPSKKNYHKGLSTSCGKHSNDANIINEIGHIYGELTVIKRAENSTDNRVSWICQCSCGNISIVRGKDLRAGKTTSCGCIRSKGMKKITQLLLENHITFISEYKFPDFLTEKSSPYRFDWGILKNNQLFCLLEYDGEQHFDISNAWYRPNIDEIKNEYCKIHNIPLYRISYRDYNNITIDFIKNIIHYGGDFNEQ